MTDGPSSSTPRPEVPQPPAVAEAAFGDRLEVATQYAALLADTGVTHGLIGPREVPRLWDRHLLNCAVIAAEFAPGAQVVDIGSGAGLPGLVLAIARPDLQLRLVEPMLRRTEWLNGAVRALGLDNVEVIRARAQELTGHVEAQYVTARAVARLETLAQWCFPLLAAHGSLVAMKGATAEAELDQDRAALTAIGMTSGVVHIHHLEGMLEPTRTVVLTIGETVGRAGVSGAHRGRQGGRTSGSTRRQSGRRGHRH